MSEISKLLVRNWRSLVGAIRAILHGLRSCKLCWRITLGIFIVFVGVELVVLKVSADRFEAEQYKIFEREALVVARSILRMADLDSGRTAFQDAGAALRDNSVLVGMRKFSQTGIALDSFGEATFIVPDTDSLVEEERQVVYPHRGRMEVVWPPSRLHAPYFVTALIDVERVSALVDAYKKRILWLILLIAGTTTMAAMLLLETLILRPVRALNDGLRRVAEDPAGSDHLVLEAVGRDEMHDVAQNFYTLIGRLQSNRKQDAVEAGDSHGAIEHTAPSGDRVRV